MLLVWLIIVSTFRVLVVLLLLSVSTEALKINCEFSYLENCARNCYQCVLHKLIITKPNQTVTGINGYHEMGESSTNVLTLKAFEQLVAYIPASLSQHFPFLSVLKIWSSGLRSLEQKDVRDLKYLTDLSVSGNRLETLNSDLFRFNQRLVKVEFTRNRLRHVGTNFFKPLKSLIVADFYQNDCISDGGRYNLEELSQRLRKKCQPTTEMATEELAALSNEIDFLRDEMRREIEARDKKLKTCEEEERPHVRLDSLFPSIVIKDRWDGP